MKTGICPKCGSATVYRHQNGFVTGDRHVVRVVLPNKIRPVITDADDFICSTCGYFERYLRQGEALTLVKQQWTHVEPQSRRATQTPTPADLPEPLPELRRRDRPEA